MAGKSKKSKGSKTARAGKKTGAKKSTAEESTAKKPTSKKGASKKSSGAAGRRSTGKKRAGRETSAPAAAPTGVLPVDLVDAEVEGIPERIEPGSATPLPAEGGPGPETLEAPEVSLAETGPEAKPEPKAKKRHGKSKKGGRKQEPETLPEPILDEPAPPAVSLDDDAPPPLTISLDDDEDDHESRERLIAEALAFVAWTLAWRTLVVVERVESPAPPPAPTIPGDAPPDSAGPEMIQALRTLGAIVLHSSDPALLAGLLARWGADVSFVRGTMWTLAIDERRAASSP